LAPNEGIAGFVVVGYTHLGVLLFLVFRVAYALLTGGNLLDRTKVVVGEGGDMSNVASGSSRLIATNIKNK
jgi:hypothetical protein